MKKLIIMLGAVAVAVGVQAASVDWKVAGTSASNGYTVYLLTELAQSYENVAALAAAAVDSGTITKVGRDYGVTSTAKSTAITTDSMKEAYWAIVTSADATSFNYVTADLSSMVYDPDKQESAPGTYNSTSAAAMLAGTKVDFGGTPGPGPSPIPEPTSGLLVLLGVAGLALKRKH